MHDMEKSSEKENGDKKGQVKIKRSIGCMEWRKALKWESIEKRDRYRIGQNTPETTLRKKIDLGVAIGTKQGRKHLILP